jgi:hypothetical protein
MEHGTGHPSPTTGPTRQPLPPPRQLRSSSLTLALPVGPRESKGPGRAEETRALPTNRSSGISRFHGPVCL